VTDRGWRTRTGALTAGFVLVTACTAGGGDEPPPPAVDTAAPVPVTSALTLLADSASGDSAAFAALPRSLRSRLDVRRMLTDEARADTSRTWCRPVGDADEPEVRRRVRFRLPDTTGVLFVRADRQTGELKRVELVRRALTARTQLGFSWDAADDVTREFEWYADEANAVESGPLPRGGPGPRALRALGRQLLVGPCTGDPL